MYLAKLLKMLFIVKYKRVTHTLTRLRLFKSLFDIHERSHMSQLNGFSTFFPSWTTSMCFFRDCFSGNPSLQVLHLKGLLSPSWFKVMWIVKDSFPKNKPSQKLHWTSSSAPWAFLQCFLRDPFSVYFASQISHLNGFFPSWTNSTCLFNAKTLV